jgi:uncharacterized protein YciI
MLWVINCIDNDNTAELRAENLDTHRAYLTSQKGIIVLAGATLSDEGEQMTGSCFVINVDSRRAAQAFSDGDPFSKAGVFKTVNITRMRKGQWNPSVGDSA